MVNGRLCSTYSVPTWLLLGPSPPWPLLKLGPTPPPPPPKREVQYKVLSRGRILGYNCEKNLFTVSSTSGVYSPPLDFLDSCSLDLRFRKKENLIENHNPYGFRNLYKTINHLIQTQVSSWIAFCRKPKPKVETSILRNLKIMPRNLNEIVLHEFGLCTLFRIPFIIQHLRKNLIWC